MHSLEKLQLGFFGVDIDDTALENDLEATPQNPVSCSAANHMVVEGAHIVACVEDNLHRWPCVLVMEPFGRSNAVEGAVPTMGGILRARSLLGVLEAFGLTCKNLETLDSSVFYLMNALRDFVSVKVFFDLVPRTKLSSNCEDRLGLSADRRPTVVFVHSLHFNRL